MGSWDLHGQWKFFGILHGQYKFNGQFCDI